MLNLKDRIGDDSIRDLAPDGLTVDWTFKNVFSLVKGIVNKTTSGVNTTYFVPLISNNRVWGYGQALSSVLKDNIAYRSTNLATSNNLIN